MFEVYSSIILCYTSGIVLNYFSVPTSNDTISRTFCGKYSENINKAEKR